MNGYHRAILNVDSLIHKLRNLLINNLLLFAELFFIIRVDQLHQRHPCSNNYRTRITRIQHPPDRTGRDFRGFISVFKIFLKFYYAARQIAEVIGKYHRLNRAQGRKNRALIGSKIMPLLSELSC
ncbi:MAG: hypothetical protein ACLFPH_04115, partial [Bacteroidales bacterium]